VSIERWNTAARAGLLLAVLSLGNFAIGMGAFVVIGVLSLIADGLALGRDGAGLLLSVYAVAYSVGSPLLVAMTGRADRRVVLVAGLAIFLGGSLLSAVAPEAWVLFVARVAAAAGAGIYTPVAAAVAVSLCAPRSPGTALSRVMLGLTMAQVLGVPLGSWVGYAYGWRASFLIVCAITALALAGVTRLVPRGVGFRAGTASGLVLLLRNPSALLAVSCTATFYAALYLVYTYLVPLLEATMGYGRNGVTVTMAIFGVGAVIGNLAGGLLADRIGTGCTLVALSAGQILAMPLFSLLPLSDAMLAFLVLAWSILGWSFMVPQQLRLVALEPPRAHVLLALNAACIYLGASMGSAVGGAVVARWGVATIGFAGAAAMVLALVQITVSAHVSRTI